MIQRWPDMFIRKLYADHVVKILYLKVPFFNSINRVRNELRPDLLL